MRSRLACTLAATLWAAGAAAQVPLQQAEAQSHIASAFVTGADPRVLAERVALGPALRKRVGDEADSRKVYDALVDATSGRDVRVRALSPAEAERFASVPGVSGAGMLFALQAPELILVLQYASPQKSVTFIEQLSAAPARAAAAPPVPPPPAPVAPKPAAVPAPAAAPAPKPAPPPVQQAPAPRPPAPKPAAAPLKPTGDCVIKPVMSDQDFVNCGATPRQPVVPR